MINITSGNADKLVVAVAHGKVSRDDYETVLIPAIETALKKHKTIRLLYQLGEGFVGFTPGAVWDDARIVLGHPTAFEAIAVVTDVHWVVHAVEFFGFFMRCPVKAFRNDELAQAKEWVTTTTWRSLAEV